MAAEGEQQRRVPPVLAGFLPPSVPPPTCAVPQAELTALEMPIADAKAIVLMPNGNALPSGDDCDVGVCFVVLRDCPEIDRGAARVGSWEVSSDADSDDVDDFVPVGKDMHRHRGFWVSFVSDTNERGAIC